MFDGTGAFGTACVSTSKGVDLVAGKITALPPAAGRIAHFDALASSRMWMRR
jgi:hypothetical protein